MKDWCQPIRLAPVFFQIWVYFPFNSQYNKIQAKINMDNNMGKGRKMKNWKKVMGMLCTAAMVTGSSAPVWAEADAAEDTETADDEITELTMDMLDEAAYEGTWLSFEPGFDLYVPSNWDVLEISDEDAADGVMFQAQDPDSEEGVNMVVTATDVGTEYDLHSMADELATEYEDVEKVCINGLYAVSFETESTYGIAFLEDAEGMMYNVQIGPKSDDIQPIAETLFVSLIKTEDNVENAEAETDAAADEEAAN